jgi:predicted esterase
LILFLKGWWFSSSDQTYDPLALTSCDQGFEESLEYVIKYINEQQIPFDGLLAFSQGAAFAALLLARLASTKYPFRFVILVASFKSGQDQHQSMYNNLQIDLPNLHVIGTGDRVIPCLMSETLANECFKNAEILRHDGGHFIPTTAETKLSYTQFLDRFL